MGMNLNWEYISREAINTFPNAYLSGHNCNFTHPGDIALFPPTVGKLDDKPYVEDCAAYAVVDFDDEFARNFEGSDSYDVSVYCRCVSHFDEKNWIRHIDEFVYDERNSIDIVAAGAVPTAQVLEQVSDSVQADFFRCSYEMVPVKVDEEPRKEVEMEKKDIIDAVNEAIAEHGAVDADRIVDAVVKAVSAAPTVEPSASIPEADMAEVITASLKAGAESGLTGKSLERVSASIKGGSSVEDAIAREKELIEEFKDQFAQEPVIADGVHAFGGNQDSRPGLDAVSVIERAFPKKGGN